MMTEITNDETARDVQALTNTIKDILYVAYRFDDKPHQLWSKLAVVATSFGDTLAAQEFEDWYTHHDPKRRELEARVQELEHEVAEHYKL